MKECKYHSCRKLIRRGTYCDEHSTSQNKYYNEQRKHDGVMKFYRSKEWREARQQALKRDCFTCSMCGGIANLVHHRVEVRTDWSKRLELGNLESVCRECHNKIEHYRK